MMTNTKKPHLHFVGIGGIGMSGIAQVFYNQGYPVSGSDQTDGEMLKKLGTMGIKTYIGHQASQVEGASVVVISSAIRDTNPEVIAAKKLRIPVIPRAEMLGELMRGKVGIALAGSHGKTTTTSLMATILSHAGLDPTIVIGGKVDALGGNAKSGSGSYVVAEADESDGSFLHLPTTYAVITNIDSDHLDHFGTLAAIEDAFCGFVGALPFYGKVYVCGDDPGVQRCIPRFTKPYATYGFSLENDLRAALIAGSDLNSFRVISKFFGDLGVIHLHLYGNHNVLNALAVIGIALELGVDFSVIADALESFQGVKRRFETRYHDEPKNIMILDDYGHHPTEIEATLLAARSFWKNRGRILLAFQPHRYSRTKNSEKEFLTCFKNADVLFLSDIYSAGEDPIPGVSSKDLAKKISHARYSGSLSETTRLIYQELKPGDLLLCMGAGSITQLPGLLINQLNPASSQNTKAPT
jgi:UDP-N-acetylmuramate--alanine ligase